MKQEWVLVLETSVAEATVLLAHGDEVKILIPFYSERSQEADLFEPLQEALAQLPEGEFLSAVVVGTGPGSYNGARVGIAAAQAIAQVHGCQVAGLSSFEGVKVLSKDGWAVGDARRGSFFYLRIENGRLKGEPVLVDVKDFQEWITTQSGPFVTFEDPVRLGTNAVIEKGTSSAPILLERWMARDDNERSTLLEKEVSAFYLRPPHITKAKPRKL